MVWWNKIHVLVFMDVNRHGWQMCLGKNSELNNEVNNVNQ